MELHAWEAENDTDSMKYEADLRLELVEKGRCRQAATELAPVAHSHLSGYGKPCNVISPIGAAASVVVCYLSQLRSSLAATALLDVLTPKVCFVLHVVSAALVPPRMGLHEKSSYLRATAAFLWDGGRCLG